MSNYLDDVVYSIVRRSLTLTLSIICIYLSVPCVPRFFSILHPDTQIRSFPRLLLFPSALFFLSRKTPLCQCTLVILVSCGLTSLLFSSLALLVRPSPYPTMLLSKHCPSKRSLLPASFLSLLLLLRSFSSAFFL